MRTWAVSDTPSFPSLLAFKAGMTHIGLIDDSDSPSKGQEIIRPVTALVFPKIFVYGARFYRKGYLYKEAAGSVYDKALALKLGMKAAKSTSTEEAKKNLKNYTDITILAFADPVGLNIGIKKQIRFEMPCGGKSIEEKFAFIESKLGKELKSTDVLAPGEFVDVIAVTKGKGWEGPIKRFHFPKQGHKATGKIRHVPILGSWHPAKVMFTAHLAGSLGFNYRTELNKKVMKLGSAQDANTVTPSGGFLHFGNIKGDYVLLNGSVPGPAKRLVRIRKALRSKGKVTVPKIAYISTASKQSA